MKNPHTNFQGGYEYTEDGKPTHGYRLYLQHTLPKQDAERINLLSKKDLTMSEAAVSLVSETCESAKGFHEAVGVIPTVLIVGSVILSILMSLF